MLFRVNGFRLNALSSPWSADVVDGQLRPALAEFFQVPVAAFDGLLKIFGKSVDARRGAPELVYDLALESRVALAAPAAALTLEELAALDIMLTAFPEPMGGMGAVTLKNPIIVGAGPAGLLAAWYLSRLGCAPVIFERGGAVDERTADLERFFATRQLDTESNFLFGAGGAGTFSDGKLYTRIHDLRANLVLKTLIAAGAPEDTAYLKRPHLGTDRLKRIVKNLQTQIEAAGGRFVYHTRIVAPVVVNGRCVGVSGATGEIFEAPAVLLAHGLGGRELTQAVIKHARYELKGFQIGCRVEHRQEWVDRRQYRTAPRPAALGAAEYSMVAPGIAGASGSGVATFCMCPGGEIVPATAWEKQLSSNGMSLRARDGRFANSALITTIAPEGFRDAAAAYAFLGDLEARSCRLGGGDYSFPAQSVASFIRREAQVTVPSETSARLGVRPGRVDELFDAAIAARLRNGMRRFESLMPGFVAGTVIGTESCVSSPVRIVRDRETLQSSLLGLYVAGEGAGYAGGIVSAAVDGLRAAEKMATAAGA